MKDLIERQAVVDTLEIGKEVLSRVLDDMNIVGVDREKYEWGLGLIESYINDIKELPSAQPEKHYTKADYIMALHKEYGCSFVAAEEAHNKALEYLRDNARMQG